MSAHGIEAGERWAEEGEEDSEVAMNWGDERGHPTNGRWLILRKLLHWRTIYDDSGGSFV
jgi:hypothetical protein